MEDHKCCNMAVVRVEAAEDDGAVVEDEFVGSFIRLTAWKAAVPAAALTFTSSSSSFFSFAHVALFCC